VNEAPRNRPDSNRREQQQQIRQPSVDRTPSQANFRDRQSRDDFQRRSTQGNVRQNDPSSWQRKNDFENRRRSGEDRRSKESRIRNQVQHFIKDNPKLYGKEYWDSKTSRPWRDDKNPNVTQRSYDDVGKGVRSSVSSRYGDRKKWFRNDFWRHHGIHPRYYRDNLNWWGGASPATIGTWIGLGATPYYYTGYADYGDSNAYWNSSAANTYVPSEAYYPSNVDTDQNTQSENDFWMPLGVFTIIADGQNESMSHLFLQLALGRDGTISGVLYDANLDKTYEVAGAVDKITQKAIWKISSGQHSPIIEAGIYNLTQEEIPVKIYVPGGSKQDRLLIRLEE